MSGMQLDIIWLVISLFAILAACELFTNGVEWLGQRLNLGEGVVGSVFAAVGTALPETLIPMIAVIFFTSGKGEEIGIGAIAGAPFMLTTLTLAMCGGATWLFARSGQRPPELSLDRTILCRDLRFFIGAYCVAMLATAAQGLPPLRWLIGCGLLLTYAVYVRQTFKDSGSIGEAPEHLHFSKMMRIPYRGLAVILPQTVIGVVGIVCSAFVFVAHVQSVSRSLGVSALILSFIIAPIATEAPEKINSILWARVGKDTLALSNVTGALVFQSCIPVAFGVAMTEWSLSAGTLASGMVAILCACAYLYLIQKQLLRPAYMMCGAIAYAAVTGFLLFSGLVSD